MANIYIDEKEAVCCNCKYFMQHYTYNEREQAFTACYAGHCFRPRMKNRKPGDEACYHWEAKEKEKC